MNVCSTDSICLPAAEESHLATVPAASRRIAICINIVMAWLQGTKIPILDIIGRYASRDRCVDRSSPNPSPPPPQPSPNTHCPSNPSGACSCPHKQQAFHSLLAAPGFKKLCRLFLPALLRSDSLLGLTPAGPGTRPTPTSGRCGSWLLAGLRVWL